MGPIVGVCLDDQVVVGDRKALTAGVRLVEGKAAPGPGNLEAADAVNDHVVIRRGGIHHGRPEIGPAKPAMSSNPAG